MYKIIKKVIHRFHYRRMLSEGTLQNKFTLIYNKNLWRSDKSISGSGSEMTYVENLTLQLPALISQLKIRSLVDAPCGDFNWMSALLPLLNIDYIGMDIVKEIIEENKKRYSSDQVDFVHSDLCVNPIPDGDLIFVRDLIFHLSYEDIGRFLRNLSKSNYKYLLITSHDHSNTFENRNILSGDFRPLDIFSCPFRFTKDGVVRSLIDSPVNSKWPRKMHLFKKCDVPFDLDLID
jgi:hypothetical protein